MRDYEKAPLLERCDRCERELPVGLTSAFIATGMKIQNVCGVCELEMSNQLHGDNRKKFNGEIAEEMRQEALDYYKKTNQI